MARPSPALALAALELLLPGAAAAGGAACECLRWRDVYASGLATCGEGAELFATLGRVGVQPREIQALYESARVVPVCDDFYRRLDNNYCANIAHSQPDESQWFAGSWCYVSSDCQDLGGGRRLADSQPPWTERLASVFQRGPSLTPGNVSWKICTPSTKMLKQDAQLRDLTLEEVFALSDQMELDAGLTVKHSLWNSWVFWHQIADQWGRGDFASLPEVIRESMSKGRPIIVDTQAGGGGDLLVIRGRELHTLELRPGARCGPTRYCRRVEAPRGA